MEILVCMQCPNGQYEMMDDGKLMECSTCKHKVASVNFLHMRIKFKLKKLNDLLQKVQDLKEEFIDKPQFDCDKLVNYEIELQGLITRYTDMFDELEDKRV